MLLTNHYFAIELLFFILWEISSRLDISIYRLRHILEIRMNKDIHRIFPSSVPTVLAGTIEFESGHPFENVEGLDEHSDLICGVCHMLPRNPIETIRCSHIFCKACIQKATGHVNPNYNGNCPLCRSPINVISNILHRISPTALTNIYNSLRIKCSLCYVHKAGLQDMDHHQMFQCLARPIQCPNKGCVVILPAGELIGSHYQTCKFYSRYCEKCHLPIRITEYNAHDCKQRLWDALYKFHKFFNSQRKEQPILTKFGAAGTSHYDIPLVNRDWFLVKYKEEGLDREMTDDSTPVNIIQKGNVLQIEDHEPSLSAFI